MTDPVLAELAAACGQTRPFALEVRRDGTVRAAGAVDGPFVLVGRDPACEVVLDHPTVSARHFALQVVAGHTFVADLSADAGPRAVGWLAPGDAVRAGPFAVTLVRPPSDAPVPDPLTDPTTPGTVGVRPAVALRFAVPGGDARDWRVNRTLTFVGSAGGCTVRLAASDVAACHAYTLLTPRGLWVVDVSGLGVCVDGELVRAASLDDGCRLKFGRFAAKVRYGAATRAGRDPNRALDPLVRQIGVAQGRITDEFRRSVAELIAAHKAEMAAVREELARLRADRGHANPPPPRHATPTRPRLAAIDEPPAGDEPPADSTEGQARLQGWVFDRINALDDERRPRWKRVLAAFRKAA